MTYRWTPVETLGNGVTDIIYRCPICALNMKGRGWSDEAISGRCLTQPTTHLDASHQNIAVGRA
eukprot:3388690-Lingulodinium_polyedra.AAC.1